MPVDPGTPGQGDPPRSQREGRSITQAAPGGHIAHFYETREEWLSLLIPWLCDGLRSGEKCIYVMNAARDWMEARERLSDDGVDIRQALETGRLEIREGCRDPRELTPAMEASLAAVPGSYPAVRCGGDMVWARERVASSGTLMHFEMGINVHRGRPISFLCQYDLTCFPGYVIMDALRTHPLSIIDGAMHHTPYHQSMDAFLKALPAREAARDVPW